MRLSPITVASLIVLAALVPAAIPAQTSRSVGITPTPGSAPATEAPTTVLGWQDMTRRDVQAYADGAWKNYIYAAYPEPAAWLARFDRIVAEVETHIPLVRDAAGYQAVLRYLGTTFHDAHTGIQFGMPPVKAEWPGFLARFDNGRYRITESRSGGLVDGSELTACDGKPVSWWIDTISRYEISTPIALETSRMTAALRLLMDRGTPLRPRPSKCVIGGRTVALDWRTAPLDELQPVILSWQGSRKRGVTTRMIGTDGAWVTLGYFAPESDEQAAAFHTAIAAAPSLRKKRFIVLDVRGNPGGPYNWFMGYLRGLYGQPYADYYATARLNIRGVYRLSSAYIALDDEAAKEADAFKTPVDATFEVNKAEDESELKRAKAAGDSLFTAGRIPIVRGVAPANPVGAQVLVLTDYGCASACIGFVDELKRFPGVRQIGLPTSVDSRSGTSVAIPLPSGNATAYLAAMTRDGRERGDNVPQLPSLRFAGDFRDDQAVERWVTNDVAKRP